jgi:hypothetical protein
MKEEEEEGRFALLKQANRSSWRVALKSFDARCNTVLQSAFGEEIKLNRSSSWLSSLDIKSIRQSAHAIALCLLLRVMAGMAYELTQDEFFNVCERLEEQISHAQERPTSFNQSLARKVCCGKYLQMLTPLLVFEALTGTELPYDPVKAEDNPIFPLVDACVMLGLPIRPSPPTASDQERIANACSQILTTYPAEDFHVGENGQVCCVYVEGLDRACASNAPNVT